MRIPLMPRNIKKSHFMWAVMIFLYCFNNIVGISYYADFFFARFDLCIRMVIIALAVVVFTHKRKYKNKTMLIFAAIIVLFFWIALLNNCTELLVVGMMIIASYGIPFATTLKLFASCILFHMGFVILSSQIGIIPDVTFQRDGMIAHGLGFIYYSVYAYLVMNLTFIYLYLKRGKIPFRNVAVLIAVNYMCYLFHSTRLSFYLTCVGIVLMWLAQKMVKLKWKGWKLVSAVAPAGCFALTWYTVTAYTQGRLIIDNPFFATIVSRLKMSMLGVSRYGISLFGNYLEVGDDPRSYFYIDSGYIYLTLAYGVIMTVVVLLLYTVLLYHLYKSKNIRGYCWLVTLLAFCCINNVLLSLSTNPLLFLLLEVFSGQRIKASNYLQKGQLDSITEKNLVLQKRFEQNK